MRGSIVMLCLVGAACIAGARENGRLLNGQADKLSSAFVAADDRYVQWLDSAHSYDAYLDAHLIFGVPDQPQPLSTVTDQTVWQITSAATPG
jgi:hypothetical protein